MQDKLTIIKYEVNNQVLWPMYVGDSLTEIAVQNEKDNSLVGAVFVGIVERVLPDVKAGFINIGRKIKGFLPINETPSFHKTQGKAPLITGQSVLVQVKKDEKGDKGVFLSRDITLVGQYVLYMPLNQFTSMSKRITDESQREYAKALAKKLTNGNCGIIIRHGALFADFDNVEAEWLSLKNQWEELQRTLAYQKPPTCVSKPQHALLAPLRDYHARYQCHVISDSNTLENEINVNGISYETLTPLELEAYIIGKQIKHHINNSLARIVPLKQGANLTIDQREALSTIDVNSGQVVNKKDLFSLAYAVNMLAIPEIAKQIRLRNLSGMILVDFIDMKTEKEEQEIEEALKQALSSDRIGVVLHGFTKLGLFEITRKRSSDSLQDLLCVPCPQCHASGYTFIKQTKKG